MRFKGLDLNLLVALDSLLSDQSVTRTAERLHLTQSAVSNALARLRTTLGDELLVPSGRRLVLTPFAAELRAEVRDILMRIDATVLAKPGFRPESSQRHFRIACSDFVAEAVLADVVREVAGTAPGISLDLLTMVSSEVFDALQSGEIDLIIAPDHYCRAGHQQAAVFNEPWTCVAWTRSRSVGATISVEQYARAEHVVLQPLGQVALDQHLLEQRGIRRRAMVTVPVFNWMLRLLAGTERIATLPRRFAASHARALQLKMVRPLFELPPLTESMQWHPSRDRDQALAWLRQLIVRVAHRPAAHGSRRRPAAQSSE
ncbi:MAG: LysR family transcriptional regulator [Gammaproteobacteria bacterium]|nr:LysR family transcriptional regulator [Gammaproteobacteria bacterium]